MGRGHAWSGLLGKRNAFGEPYPPPEAPTLLDALAELARGLGRGDRRGVPRGGEGRDGAGRDAASGTRAPGAPPRRSCCSTGKAR